MSADVAIAFGLFLWLTVRFVIKPVWRGRATSADTLFQWVLPGIFVVGGIVAELVAAYGAITGTTWHGG
jgi:hypothetical protein